MDQIYVKIYSHTPKIKAIPFCLFSQQRQKRPMEFQGFTLKNITDTQVTLNSRPFEVFTPMVTGTTKVMTKWSPHEDCRWQIISHHMHCHLISHAHSPPIAKFIPWVQHHTTYWIRTKQLTFWGMWFPPSCLLWTGWYAWPVYELGRKRRHK